MRHEHELDPWAPALCLASTVPSVTSRRTDLNRTEQLLGGGPRLATGYLHLHVRVALHPDDLSEGDADRGMSLSAQLS